MQKIILSTTINAPKEKVWEVLWDLDAWNSSKNDNDEDYDEQDVVPDDDDGDDNK